MHAFRILQGFLSQHCADIHAKRRHCLAQIAAAARGGLGVVKLGRALTTKTDLRHRIKCCDRLLSNRHLAQERVMLYQAMARQVLPANATVSIVVDWSGLGKDGSAQLLRAAVVMQGRAFTLYEEVYPLASLSSPVVQRKFMQTVRDILPSGCKPIMITDAGFRSPWFKMLNQLGFAWIGRIRNRDKVCVPHLQNWHGCKSLYAGAGPKARDLGPHLYTRSNPTPCRLVLAKRPPRGRHAKGKGGKRKRSSDSKKIAIAQNEPWLLAVSPSLSALAAADIIAIYEGRMQIEQTFRDLKNPQWGMALRHSQTYEPRRLMNLLVIAALFAYALWIIGLAARKVGYDQRYGSNRKAATMLSVLSLARQWLGAHHRPRILIIHLRDALNELRQLVRVHCF